MFRFLLCFKYTLFIGPVKIKIEFILKRFEILFGVDLASFQFIPPALRREVGPVYRSHHFNFTLY